MNIEPSRHLVRTKEAATYCGLAASTLEKLRVYGGGPTFRKLGKVVVYDRADLDAWLDSHPRLGSTSELGQEAVSR